jgi:hypothetical protein
VCFRGVIRSVLSPNGCETCDSVKPNAKSSSFWTEIADLSIIPSIPGLNELCAEDPLDACGRNGPLVRSQSRLLSTNPRENRTSVRTRPKDVWDRCSLLRTDGNFSTVVSGHSFILRCSCEANMSLAFDPGGRGIITVGP